jgi:hypothetical protein
MRGADAVTVGDGGQTLDVSAQNLGEHARLRVTQLGELGRNLGHRAVVLTDLNTDGGSGDLLDRCGVTLVGEQSRQFARSIFERYLGQSHRESITLGVEPGFGERPYAIIAQ